MALNAHLSHLAIGSPDPLVMATFYEKAMGNTIEDIDQGYISAGRVESFCLLPAKRKSLNILPWE
ncbi:hypothetical protein [Marinomonas rhodophyticola]|uniref:Glyoxalase/bleomycin resistance protein/dioxygenase superfamily protein n=1 Tax=Marinomonas rhodophyticola TaxID=2992803 RepID=A0ABT3KB56_9GAMM|nr:hypothetical protein [Marinomonas sp. KJ51-3]MCW4627753.1 hypothetical protein [Marinomonas sp. KJ51-3]